VAGPAAPGQVVEVRADRADGRVRVGSGLLVTGRLVLTAAHVVFPDGPDPAVRVGLTIGVGEGGRASVAGRVVWPPRWAGPQTPAGTAHADDVHAGTVHADADTAHADAAHADAAPTDAAPTDAALVEIVGGTGCRRRWTGCGGGC
jgi:hypothetical protein